MMKKILILTAILVLSFTNAQELKTVKLLPPESKDLSDLAFLKEELQGKELVMLGEYTHMYGNIFEMKARVVEYLHQELGYTTFAIESPMYDIWKMNQKGFDKTEFNEAIWGVWSSSKEFQRLVNYIEENNLKVIGFDSQIINSSSFIEDFYDYCESREIELKLDQDDLGIIIEGILENGTIEEEDINYVSYEKELNRVIQKIERLEATETNYYWLQFTKNLLASSQDANQNRQPILTTDFGNKNHNIRDKQMADNLLSYIAKNPNEKLIIWADNIHIINDNSSITKPVSSAFISMGTHIKQALKKNVYSLATIHANDSLFDTGTQKWEQTPVLKNSFEDQLRSFNEPFLFISSEQKAMHTAKQTRILDFIDFSSARLDQLHDGYLFLAAATLPKHKNTNETNSAENPELVETIKPISNGTHKLFKGQVLNSQNKEPIPFATLVLKKEEIYRVADENGFFEVPVRNDQIKKALVSISSMGFEPRSINLENLAEKLYLTPKFQELTEVIINGFLSPKAVLKKAVYNKDKNHPVQPFNFKRYGRVITNVNDTTKLDFEMLSKDYDRGYLSPYVITQRVEQIKWNKNLFPEKISTSSQFFSYRQNAVRYANILHKRKYKKFDLKFVTSTQAEDEGLYIIAFSTERDKWNYTNRSYPTKYSGKVYIKKESFAIVKVIENWETALDQEELDIYAKNNTQLRDKIAFLRKEENKCTYSDINNDGVYYATNFYNSRYLESVSKQNKSQNSIIEMDSYLFDFEINNPEEIEYYEYNNKKENSLYRISYSQSFWDTFYEEKLPLLLN
ncbi:erythromycin esterase family protein [Leeuwenhoekiella aequorea]|uniref:erythromycin esterase family protein n=1 Tax=Leeuwenhoekiella aequorea TaxID=283736 RepID=UPI00352C2887|tara:strand:- start:238 stop:2631 length:2394 start_codon:yes stop_codon:yes gene_type:complete